MKRWVVGLLILALTLAMPFCVQAETAGENVCATAEEYLNALLAVKAANPQRSYISFDIWVSDELKEALFADDFALMMQLEIQAGIVETNYGTLSSKIAYKNCIFDDSAPHVQDLNGLVEAINQSARDLKDVIYIVCDQALYDQITGDMWSEVRWIAIENCGIRDGRCSSSALPVLTIRPSSYYPSYRLLHALETGDSSALSDAELQALKTAQAWASEIVPGSTEDVMRQIHDLICERVDYDNGETLDKDLRHSCLGALLEGLCVCDGYADTFYLLGTLCGLDVRFQIGLTPTAEGEEVDYWRSNHAWNWVKVDGEWRMVDITWDDLDPGIDYTYFNLPASAVPEDHTWVWNPDGSRN